MRLYGTLVADNVGVDITDGTYSFPHENTLHFNPAHFYLTKSSLDRPVVNYTKTFQGCMVQSDVDNVLGNGIAELVTFGNEVYDHGNWFNAGVSATDFTVPAGVELIVCFAKVIFTPTGTPTNSSNVAISVLKNAADVPTNIGTRCVSPAVVSSGVPMSVTFTTGPLQVKPGDVITFQALANIAGVSAITITAATTYAGMYALR